jgi:DNA primase
MSVPHEIVIAGDHEVQISSPGKVLFPKAGYTKLDLVRYYLVVADGALRGSGGRPNMLVRYPNGIDGEFFYQRSTDGCASLLAGSRSTASPIRRRDARLYTLRHVSATDTP